MNRKLPLPIQGPIAERCRIIARVEAALCRKAGVRMIACSNSRIGYRGFLIVEPNILQSMDDRSRDALMQSKEVVARIVGDFKLTLFKEARQLGQQEVFHRYWPKYREPKKAENVSENDARNFFNTFDDCSSVWTHESNWKQRTHKT